MQEQMYSRDQMSIIIFEVAGEQFGIDLLDVKEIIQAGQIRRLPKSLDFVEGIYNYRGDIIHIINLKKKLNLNEYGLYKLKKSLINETDENNDDSNKLTQKFIIIVNINNNNIGFYVDQIINVSNISSEEIIGLSPIFQTSIGIEYINGIIKFKDKPRILIDLSKILSEAEQLSIQQEHSMLK